MISRTKIKQRLEKKTNPIVKTTLSSGLKNEKWVPVIKIISGSTRKYASVNLQDIDKKTKLGDTVVIPGKVLAAGEISKKVRICSLSISVSAREKLKKTKSEYASIIDEIKINPKAEGIKIIQ